MARTRRRHDRLPAPERGRARSVEAAAQAAASAVASEEEAEMKGLREFILRGNLVDLAVAVVIGAAFGAVVSALVKDLITPLIGAIGGKPDFSALSFTVNKSHFLYGEFINALLAFLVIATVVYFFVVKPVAALMDRFMPKKEVGPQRECPECLSDIPAGARRCAFCTAEVGPAPATGASPLPG
jgi:large conductance mechanosensitive channel